MQRIMGIDWFNNDMGFTTCAYDGNIYFYELYGGEVGERKRSYEANFRDVKFSSVVNLPGKQQPGKKYEFLAVGSEKTIHTESDYLKVLPRS